MIEIFYKCTCSKCKKTSVIVSSEDCGSQPTQYVIQNYGWSLTEDGLEMCLQCKLEQERSDD